MLTIEFGADLVGAQFVQNRRGVIEQRRFVADREDAHLFRREPEREIAGVMLDQEADETLVRAERRAMNAERRLLGVVAVFVSEIETARLREIDLVGGDGEFAADRRSRPARRSSVRKTRLR